MIKYVFIIDKIPVFISNKKPFSVGSDSICKLPGNKVDCFKYGAKWNKYLFNKYVIRISEAAINQAMAFKKFKALAWLRTHSHKLEL